MSAKTCRRWQAVDPMETFLAQATAGLAALFLWYVSFAVCVTLFLPKTAHDVSVPKTETNKLKQLWQKAAHLSYWGCRMQDMRPQVKLLTNTEAPCRRQLPWLVPATNEFTNRGQQLYLTMITSCVCATAFHS